MYAGIEFGAIIISGLLLWVKESVKIVLTFIWLEDHKTI